jgi:hypothetical protein
MERSSRAVAAGTLTAAIEHQLAMLVMILPFGLLAALIEWERQIQIAASQMITGYGFFRLVNQRHAV